MLKKAIFWDFDGTLVRSNHLWSGSLYRALGGSGNPYGIAFEDVRPLMRSGLTWHMPQFSYPHMTGGAWWDYTRAALAAICVRLGAGIDEALRAAERAREIILDPSSYELFDDTRETLERCLALGYENHILSNNYPELGDTLEALDLARYFAGCTVSAKVGFEKPRPEIFDIALEKAGRPAAAYMVGDNPRADIEGANNCGMVSVLVHSESPAAARHRCGELKEIPCILT